MLYLGTRNHSHSKDTQKALHAADGYLYLRMPQEALEELDGVPPSERKVPAVLLARIQNWATGRSIRHQRTQLYQRPAIE